MATRAMGSFCKKGHWRNSPMNIDFVGYWFKMLWIYTNMVAAQMIHFDVLRNWTEKILEKKSRCIMCFTVNIHLPILSDFIDCARPQQASRIGISLSKFYKFCSWTRNHRFATTSDAATLAGPTGDHGRNSPKFISADFANTINFHPWYFITVHRLCNDS